MKLFDPHAHLTADRFRDDLPEVLARMRAAGVCGAIVMADPGDEEPDHVEAGAIVSANPGFFLSIGVHPHNAKGYTPEAENIVREYAKRPDCACLGEIGLDFYYDFSPRDVQRDAFERQMDLALELDLPVQLHIRDAHGEATDRLRARHRAGALPRGVMHCYSGSWESAKTYLSMGLYISLSGVVTFKNAPKVWEVARNVPDDRLFVETDCPFMAPAPMRGKRNEPAFLGYTLARVAELRGAEPEALSARIAQNLADLYDIRI
jgi:TatD DNase family protein